MGCCQALNKENSEQIDFTKNDFISNQQCTILKKTKTTMKTNEEQILITICNTEEKNNQINISEIDDQQNPMSKVDSDYTQVIKPFEQQFEFNEKKIFLTIKHNDSNQLEKSNNSTRFDIPRLKDLKLAKQQISESIINTRKKLVLTVIEAKFLLIGLQLIINAGGLEGSERNAKDGVVLFGNKPQKKTSIPNDFNFPNEEKIGEKHFQIKYDIEKDNYYAKDLFGSGLFIKLKFPVLLKSNSIFSFVSCHILVTIPIELNISSSINANTNKENRDRDDTLQINNIIKFKVLYGVNKGKEYIFDGTKIPVITFGRSPSRKDSYLQFYDENISRTQSTVFFKDSNWYLIDSDGELSSMNGTWLLADDFYLLEKGIILRAGTTSFECSLIESYEEI